MQERSNTRQRFALRQPLVFWTVAIIVPIFVVGIAGCLDQEASDNEAGAIAGLESIAWPRESSPRTPVTAAPTNPAPVGDLITGLEERLANDPNDVKGWALLAQSYAFVADEHGAEAALAKAVALGFDEADLRQRIELASQSSQTTAIRQ